MGQKVNPNGIRLGINKDWTSKWFARSKEFASYLNADLKIRKYLRKKLKGASISRIQIERPARNAKVAIFSARPGVIIGKKGGDVEVLRSNLQKMIDVPVHLTIEEIRKPELDAHLVAANIAQQLEKRVAFRRTIRMAVQRAQRAGVLGLKIQVSGRLNGAEIARTEWTREGRVPLHTLRADIDYATKVATTTYGVLGIKVWVFKGEVLSEQAQPMPVGATPRRRASRRPQQFEDRSNEG